MTLTERQFQSLDIRKNLAVTAGAGSGKTRVLVERYLTILKSDSNIMPRNILALTFTDKAASEMKERIKRSVREMLPSDRSRWSAVLDDMTSADISTIHSFCTRLIRNDPIPCGLDPDLRTITETEGLEMMRRSINLILTVDGKESPALRRLIVDMGARNLARSLVSLLKERSKVHIKIGSDEFRKRSLDHLARSWDELLNSAREELCDLKEDLLWLSEIDVPDVPRDTAVPVLGSLKPFLNSLDLLEDPKGVGALLGLLNDAKEHLLTKNGKERGVGRLGNTRVWGPDHGRLKKVFTGLFPFVHRYKDLLVLVSSEDIRKRAEERISDMIEVYGAVEKDLTKRKRESNGVDFDDQIALAIELLEKDRSPSLLGLRKRYSHLLVDEFQDTDPYQWKLVDLLWDEGRTSKLFIVGDPKQSIYGFRSADVRLFHESKNILMDHKEGDNIVLDKNFRSKKEIMEFVNALFPTVMEDDGSEWGVEFDPLEPSRGAGGSIKIMGVLGSKGSEAREGARAAALIKEAVREWKVSEDGEERSLHYGDIAILLPTRKGFSHYEDSLRSHRIPFQVYKGKGFFERQEVKDVLNLLTFLTNPADDLSLASLLKGPFFGLSDEDLLEISTSGSGTLKDRLGKVERFHQEMELITDMIHISGSMLPHAALHRILLLLGADALMGGARGSRNLDRLVEWSLAESSARSMLELKDRLKNLVDEPPNEGEPPLDVEEDYVSVMTVHAAKGLEWPMVLVLGINHEPRGGFTRSYNLDPENGISIKVMDTSTGELVKTPSFFSMEEDAKDKEMQERKRLFYVACTRAKDHLVLSGSLPIDNMDRVKEPYGMMKFLWNSMDLSMDDLDLGAKEIGGVNVELIKVPKQDIVEEVEELPEEEVHSDVDLTEEIIVPGPLRSSRNTFLLSPSRVLMSADELRGFPLDYPEPGEQIPPDVLGDMVHAVLQGIPMERVIREMGYPDKADIVEKEVDMIRSKLHDFGITPIRNEVEVVGYTDDGPLLGRIDLLARDKDGKLILVDFKTGKEKKKHTQQVMIYQELLKDVVDEKVSTRIISSKD